MVADRDKGFRVGRNGPVATVTFDRPPANTMAPVMIEALIEELPDLAADPDVRCLVLTGTGRVFIGGADISVMRRLDPAVCRAMRRWTIVQEIIEGAPKPVVAALNGHALGGGAELALACDLRILRETATFGFPEIGLGIFPGAGGSQRLPRLIGAHLAKRLMIDGTRLGAEQAAALGLVDIVTTADDFAAVVNREAERLAALPTATVGLIKQVVAEGAGLSLGAALEIEERYVLANLQLQDAAEGLQAFLEKRPPRFLGR